MSVLHLQIRNADRVLVGDQPNWDLPIPRLGEFMQATRTLVVRDVVWELRYRQRPLVTVVLGEQVS